jgi:protein-S-isoprenylcysteine O-methyltransferase Ste14
MKSGPSLKHFLSNPLVRGEFEWLVLLVTGVCGLVFSWRKLSIFPVSNILGGIMILGALLFHWRVEKDHKQAHERTEDIDRIVMTGAYSKIRHPLYLSGIILNIGIALSFGILVTLIFALLTIVHRIATSYFEERALEARFGEEYVQYKQSVRWRMIPGIY